MKNHKRSSFISVVYVHTSISPRIASLSTWHPNSIDTEIGWFPSAFCGGTARPQGTCHTYGASLPQQAGVGIDGCTTVTHGHSLNYSAQSRRIWDEKILTCWIRTCGPRRGNRRSWIGLSGDGLTVTSERSGRMQSVRRCCSLSKRIRFHWAVWKAQPRTLSKLRLSDHKI